MSVTDFTENESEDSEWDRLKRKRNEGEVKVSTSKLAREIVKGFYICSLSMKDKTTNDDILSLNGNDFDSIFVEELTVHTTKKLFMCETIMRYIVFKSQSEIKDLKMVQKTYLDGSVLERLDFNFGFVIPGSTNTW